MGVIMYFIKKIFLSVIFLSTHFLLSVQTQNFETDRRQAIADSFVNTMGLYFDKKEAPFSDLLSQVVTVNEALHSSDATPLYSSADDYFHAFLKKVFTKPVRVTPTEAHIILQIKNRNLRCEREYALNQYLSNKTLMDLAAHINLLQRGSNSENEVSEQYYSYVHAHQWSLDFPQMIYAELHPQTTTFFPLHFLTLSSNAITADKEHDLVASLLQHGCEQWSAQRFLLSMNSPFFGNLHNTSSCTAHYFLNNYSSYIPYTIIEDLFEAEGHRDLYNKYLDDFNNLAVQHADCSKYGKVWVIKVPRAIHKDVVIVTRPIGYVRTVTINGIATNDVTVIQDTLCTHPEAIEEDLDELQFRMLMTPSTGLNPHLGIKTVPLHCADPVKYAEFKKEFTKLMDKLKYDISVKPPKDIHFWTNLIPSFLG